LFVGQLVILSEIFELPRTKRQLENWEFQAVEKDILRLIA